MRATVEVIVDLTDGFCRHYLNQEYADLCRTMAAAISRKRPSPLLGGKTRSWACGIVYTLGRVNFLFDKAQTPHMSSAKLCAGFGVSSSTASAKSKRIMGCLGIKVMDPCWCLPGMIDKNPLAWLIEVNGMVVDARILPREMQEEAFRRGLIPYVRDRSSDTEDSFNARR